MNIPLKTLQLKARHQVYTFLSGHSLSKHHGEGYDFAELREYQMGDDIRKINWMITAKLGKPYIKEFQASRELSVVVATLMDGSVYFGSENAKQHKFTEVSTLLGYAATQNGDLFTGIHYYPNDTTVIAPSKHAHNVERSSQSLFEASLFGTSLDYHASLQDLYKRLSRPSLVFVLGDFLEDVDLSLLAQKHEVITIVIRDKGEESLKSLGEATLLSPQNNTVKKTYLGKKAIQKYLSKLKENDERLMQHFSMHDIRYVKISTADNAISKLVSLFS